MKKVAVLLMYVTVCGAVKEKMVFVLFEPTINADRQESDSHVLSVQRGTFKQEWKDHYALLGVRQHASL